MKKKMVGGKAVVTADKKLTGRQVELLQGRLLDFGFAQNDDGTPAVYVMSFEA